MVLLDASQRLSGRSSTASGCSRRASTPTLRSWSPSRVTSAGGDAIDALASLVAKSMVNADETSSGARTTRYRLLETMRAYARDRLSEDGDLEVAQRRHAAHFAEFAERAGPEFMQKDELAWRAKVQLEIHNLRSAAMGAISGSTVEAVRLGARVIIALGFESVSTQSNVGAWADRAIAKVSETIPEVRPTVIAIAAWSRYWSGDLDIGSPTGRGG